MGEACGPSEEDIALASILRETHVGKVGRVGVDLSTLCLLSDLIEQ